MKKLILLALSLCLLILSASGCAKNAETPSPEEAAAPAGTSEQSETQQPPEAVAAPDPEATAFVSAESLAAGVRQARETDARDRTEAQTMLAELDEVYAPEAEFDGFVLLGVEAVEGFLVYYYMPAEGPVRDSFDYRIGITVAVCMDPEITLEQVCEQMGIAPDADGYAYDAEHQQMYFTQDGHTCSLQVPEGEADPEAMKKLCRIKRLDLN